MPPNRKRVRAVLATIFHLYRQLHYSTENSENLSSARVECNGHFDNLYILNFRLPFKRDKEIVTKKRFN
uniref:Uncharacterized protein n=1 Tax=Rhizophora mucronata TaxID=61149 RepID=A0A2P2PVT5_RHIMU